MLKLAVLVSNAGSGTNLQAIIGAIESKRLKATISVVISSDDDAFGLERAKKHHLPSLVVDKNEDLTHILEKKYHVDYLVLAGWKRIIPHIMIDTFSHRILNLHPGLIPDLIDGKVKNPDGTYGLWNRGKLTDLAIQNFLDNHATYAGSTVHFLSNKFDFGPVLARCFEKINKNDTVKALYSRLKKKENQIYVEALIRLSQSYL